MKKRFNDLDLKKCVICKKPETEVKFNRANPECVDCRRSKAKKDRPGYLKLHKEKRGFSNNKPVQIFELETQFNSQPFAWVWSNF